MLFFRVIYIMLLAKGEVEAVSVVFERKNSYTIADLLEIMKLLRSEGGCPWDQEQTHESIRRDLIEETYEACEAIDQQDKAALQEEQIGRASCRESVFCWV